MRLRSTRPSWIVYKRVLFSFLDTGHHKKTEVVGPLFFSIVDNIKVGQNTKRTTEKQKDDGFLFSIILPMSSQQLLFRG
jgi:hypothetical protein